MPALVGVCCIDHAINNSLNSPIFGYLGMDGVKDFKICIDFDRGWLSFLRSVPRNAGARVPLTLRNGCPQVSVTINGRGYSFIIDTGCLSYGAGAACKRDFDAMVVRNEMLVVDTRSMASDFGEGIHRTGVLAVPMAIGPFHHEGLVFADLADASSADNILGIDFLRRYLVTIDFAENAIYLSPGRNVELIDASRDPGGLRLARSQGRIVVTCVGWRCAASAAGIRAGDEVVKVNGNVAMERNDVELAIDLSRRSGPTSIEVRRRRDGGIIDYMFSTTADGEIVSISPREQGEGR